MTLGTAGRDRLFSRSPGRTALVAAAVVAFATSSSTALASPGQLDPTFGSGGIAAGCCPNASFAVDRSGGVLAATVVSPANTQNTDVELTRLLPDGATDQSFGQSGHVTLTWDLFPVYNLNLLEQPDGKLLIVAVKYDQTFVRFERLLAGGSVDPSFALHDEPVSAGRGGAVSLQGDGSIVMLSGWNAYWFSPAGRLTRSVSLAAFFPSGQYAPFPPVALPGGEFLFAYGGAVMRLPPEVDAAVAKMTVSGTPDRSFGSNGVVQAGCVGNDFQVQANGDFLIAGDCGLQRFLPNGSADSGFGSGGTVNFTSHEVSQLPDGELFVGGDNGSTSGWEILNSDGSTSVPFTASTAVILKQQGNPTQVDNVQQCQGREIIAARVESATDPGVSDSAGRVDVPTLSPQHGVDGYSVDALGGLSSFTSRTTGSPAVPCTATGASELLSRGIAMVPTGGAGYVLDAYGGLNGFTATGPLPQPATLPDLWPGWDIARGLSILPDGTGGSVLDGWGGIHTFGLEGHPAPTVTTSSSWNPGWDINRAIATLPSSSGGLVLDGWGGLHPFALNGNAAPTFTSTAWWPGWDIARAMALLPSGTGGVVLDGWGGVHGFGVNGGAAPAVTASTGYWPGWDVARGLVVLPAGTGGYVLDRWGGLHPFALDGNPLPPAVSSNGYWTGGNVRGVVLTP